MAASAALRRRFGFLELLRGLAARLALDTPAAPLSGMAIAAAL
jgi:hypothetical protein